MRRSRPGLAGARVLAHTAAGTAPTVSGWRPSRGGGLIGGAARTSGTLLSAASAVGHVGWWMVWHTRARPTEGCRPASKAPRAPARQRRSFADELIL